MGYKSQVPLHGAAQPIAPPAPPDAPVPNMAMLKGDIDSGRTGDKVPVFDPGMAIRHLRRGGRHPAQPGAGQARPPGGNQTPLALRHAQGERRPEQERLGRAVRLLRPDRRDRRGDRGLSLADVSGPERVNAADHSRSSAAERSGQERPAGHKAFAWSGLSPQAAASIAAGAWTAPWRRLAMMPMICCGK